MLKIPEIFKGTENFWEWNSEYRIIFIDFYNKDKTKLKTKSSRVMWGLYFLLHPKSALYNIPNKEELIQKNYIKDPKFNWKDTEELQSTFKSSILTQAQRGLVSWDEFMRKKDQYLTSMEYYFDQYAVDEEGNNILSKTGGFVTVKGTAEQLDKAWSYTPKYYAEFDKISKNLANEEAKRGRGNRPKSPSETGEI